MRLGMKTRNIAAALALIISAAVAQAQTPISALPVVISSPGTYVLTCNLISPPVPQSAILITGSAGAVVLDLRGFTIMLCANYPNYYYTGISVQRSNVTIRNGTIKNFNDPINVCPPGNVGYLSGIVVDHVTFTGADETHIAFFQVKSSSVSNCCFQGVAQAAIYDYQSQPTNCIKNTFDGNQRSVLSIVFPPGPVLLEQAKFATQ